MVSPRWFLVALSLVGLHGCLVLGSLAWKLASADDTGNQRPPTPIGNSEAVEAPRLGTTDTAPETEVDQARLPTAATPEPPDAVALKDLPHPDEMPDFPSLADPEQLSKDPIFQEFRRMFSGEQDWKSAEPPVGSSGLQLTSVVQIQALDRRLETVEQMCKAARGLLVEASHQAWLGKSQRSSELTAMAKQLRGMAANLLRDEDL